MGSSTPRQRMPDLLPQLGPVVAAAAVVVEVLVARQWRQDDDRRFVPPVLDVVEGEQLTERSQLRGSTASMSTAASIGTSSMMLLRTWSSWSGHCSTARGIC